MELWIKKDELGSGTFGTVFLASSGFSTNPVAVKTAYWDVSFAVESLRREAGMFKLLAGAQNVLQCFGDDISVENNRLSYNLLLEYAPLGNLEDVIKKKGPVSEFQAARYARMMLRGLEEIHSRGIVHCDLKAANILVFPGNELKIADLGLAKLVSEGVVNKTPTFEGYSGRRYYNRGSPTTASPESVRWNFGGCGYHSACADVWSIGCIVYHMLTGKEVWNYPCDPEMLYDQILNNPIPVPENLSQDGVSFLNQMLTRSISQRLSAKELLTHPFIIKNLGFNRMSRIGGNADQWISKMDMFSERLYNGEVPRFLSAVSRLTMEPAADTCHQQNACRYCDFTSSASTMVQNPRAWMILNTSITLQICPGMSSLVGNMACNISSLSTRNSSADNLSLIPVSSTKTRAASIAFIPIIFAFKDHSKVLPYLASIFS